jgi:hypothetical protein
METVRANLTTDPAESIELELAFAEERALEVGQTADHGEPAHLGQALDNYGETIAAVAQGVGLVEGPAREKREAELTQALAVHDRMLERAFDGEDGDQNQDQIRDHIQDRQVWCGPDGEVFEGHPAAEMIAERNELEYEVVMGWFCESGVGFGEIMLAIRVCGSADGTCVGGLFEQRQGDPPAGWGHIMRDHELIGRPEHAGPRDDVPPGPPDHAGPPDEVPPGPPDHAGPPDEISPGPPDHAGPPDEVSPGPPAEVPPGPPEDVPSGQGDDAGTGDAPQGPDGKGGAEGGNGGQ